MPKKRKKASKKQIHRNIERKLDLILKRENLLSKEEKGIENLEKTEIKELKDLEVLEEQIKNQVSPHPLTTITLRDISKGVIGAFVGVISHFAFAEGAELAKHIDVFRANIMLVASFLIGLIFLYFTGYRRVKDTKLLKFLPVRLLVIYTVAIAVSFIVLTMFNLTAQSDPSLIYKQVAVVSLLAVLGASAADLIGEH